MRVNPQHIEIVRFAVAINDDLSQAIAYHELSIPAGLSAPLIERVNQHLIHEGFNVVSEGLELGVITILCRIWDKRRGTARITEVVSRLRKNPTVVSDQTAFARWQADVEKFEKSEHLTVLRSFRNVGLAHRNDPNLPDPRSKYNTRRVLYGDARIVLEGTIPIVHRLNSLIVGVTRSTDFERKRQEWETAGGKIWGCPGRACYPLSGGRRCGLAVDPGMRVAM
jgi:hypothetical protein